MAKSRQTHTAETLMTKPELPLPPGGEIDGLPVAAVTCTTTKQANGHNILLIGVGPFAKRTYIPHLKRLEIEKRVSFVAAVDITDAREDLLDYQQKVCPGVEFIFVPYFTSLMPGSVDLLLTDLVRRLHVSCILISTEPQAHRAYGMWALGLGLNIIMDKPVSTRAGVVESAAEARGIGEDFEALLSQYRALQTHQRSCFLVNSQRRYHAEFQYIFAKIRGVQEQTGCPVTNVRSVHSDGQWRFPSEIIRQDYHTYNQGFGKISHSGYHALDAVYQFIKAGVGQNKRPTAVEVISSLVQPCGFFFQINEDDYGRLFTSQAYSAVCGSSEEELRERARAFGEIDATIQLTFYHGVDAVALATVDLQHNGFSRRSWLQPGQDLYKGNGRVRHETHEIVSGPFQTIVMSSRRSSDEHEVTKQDCAGVEEDTSSDMKIFQNSRMLGCQSYLEVVKLGQLVSKPQGYSASVKHAVLDEAVDFMDGKMSLEDLRSNLPDHSVPVHIMSAAYVSNCKRKQGLNPLVRLDLTFDDGDGSMQAQFSPPTE